MKTGMRKLGSGWKITTALLTAGLIMLGPGCICIQNQATVSSSGAPSTASIGGGQPAPMAAPAGGNFAPVQALISGTTGTTTVCNQTVSKKHVSFYYPTVPGPTAGETHFQGRLKKMDTGALIPTSNYVLQWWITLANQGCATVIDGTDVRFPAQQGANYQLTAHFKPGYVPAGNPTIELEGAWITL